MGAIVRNEQRFGGVAPTRTCVGCRRKAPKPEFVRFVRGPSGEIQVDSEGKAPGRGAYVCADDRCFEAAMRRGRLARALRSEIGASERERLVEEFGSRGAR